MPDCKKYGGINRSELVNLRKDLASEGIVVQKATTLKCKVLSA
jgi:hypothetical protein